MKILVTGSSGMIGSALVEKLKDEGFGVDCLDIRMPEYHNYGTIIHDLREPIKVTVGDIDKYDLVVHLAANARVHDLVVDPEKALENIKMTHNILEFCRKTGIQKFLFASSREVYGNTPGPVREEYGSQRDSKNVYTSSKIAGESYCNAYQECYDMETVIMRFSNVYGRYDESNRFIPKAISRLRNNEPFEIYGADKILDFTYLDDCVNGIMHIIKFWDRDLRISGFREFNIASGVASGLEDVAKELKTLLNSTSEITVGERLTGELDTYQADIHKMGALFGWRPQTTLTEGLEKSIKYYVS